MTTSRITRVLATGAVAAALCGLTGTAAATTPPAGSAAPGTSGGTDPLAALPACDVTALDGADGPVEITVWSSMKADLLNKTMDELTQAFNASQTQVKANYVNQGGYEDTIPKFLDADQGSRPDVVQLPEYIVRSVIDLKTAVPVGACIKSAGFDTSPFIPSTLAQYAAGGVQWSLPFNVSDPVLLYNKKLFAAAGLDPNTPPVTLEDVAAMSKTLVDSGAAKYGIAIDSNFDNGGGWFLEQWLAKLGQFYTDNDNGRSARATKVTFNTPELAGVLTTLQTMVKDGTALDVGDNPSGADNLLAMADKDAPAAMTIATSASIGSVLTILKGGQFPHLTVDDVAVAPMPGPGSPGTLVGGASLWINDSGDPARVAAAWKYLEFMTAAQQQATWAATTGYVALRADATELEPLKTALADPRFTVAGKQLQDIPAVATSTGPVVGPLLEIRTAVAEGVAKILNGEDVTATLAEMESQANALITDYNERNPG